LASEWLERMRSIGVISRRSGDQRNEGRDQHGRRYKAVTDELNNTVTQRHNERGTEVQDVLVRAPHIRQYTTTVEERT
jgi:hypothetical protein